MSKLFESEEAAAEWDARLRGAKMSFRERRAFQAWLRQDPGHVAAHDRLQAALAALRDHARLAELSALREEAVNSVRKLRRRRTAGVASLAAAAALLLVFGIASQTERGAELAAQLRGDSIFGTAPNERTRVTLADGSVVTLDASTRLTAHLEPRRRTITLLAGRALFEVAHDRQRPFVVRAGDRTITALGTVFDVRLSPRELRVTLAEGSVAVRPVHAQRGSTESILKPREAFVESAGAPLPKLVTVDTDKALGWAHGQVFFENDTLASAVEEMNQHAAVKITVDPAAADLRLSGMFLTGNQSAFVEALQLAMPVAVRRDDEGRLVVYRKPDRPAGAADCAGALDQPCRRAPGDLSPDDRRRVP